MPEKSETDLTPTVEDLRYGYGISQANSNDPRVGCTKRVRQLHIEKTRVNVIESLGDASCLPKYLELQRSKYLKSQWKKYILSEGKKKYKKYLESKLKSTHSDAYKMRLKYKCRKRMVSKVNAMLKAKPSPEYIPFPSQFDVNDPDNFLLGEFLAGKYQFMIENEEQLRLKGDLKTAKRALAHYNQTNGVRYELVEVLGSIVVKLVGFWYHCNFRARQVDGDDPSLKLFFAELHDFSPLTIIKCCILDESKAVLGCEMCPSPMAHPQNGFEKGLPGTVSDGWRKVVG